MVFALGLFLVQYRGMTDKQGKEQALEKYFKNKSDEISVLKGDKAELYKKLKTITDYYIGVLHQLRGYHQDSIMGFSAYLKNTEKIQQDSIRDLNMTIEEIDKVQMIYSSGAPDDPEAVMIHECTQGQLKERLQKGALNEILLGYFCLSMIYDFWEDVRGLLAGELKIEKNSIVADVFGDIRNLRNDIMHHKGVATRQNVGKNKMFTWFKEGEIILLTAERLDEVIAKIFDFINDFIYSHVGHKPYADYSLSLVSKRRQMEHIRDGNMKVQ